MKKTLRFTLNFFLSFGVFFYGTVMVLILTTAHQHQRAYETMEPPEVKVLVVLGYEAGDEAMPLPLQARLDKAAALFDNDFTEFIMVTGGKRGQLGTESEVMKSYLLTKGIPEEVIIEECDARTTVENLKFCRSVLDTLTDQPILLVTSNAHLCRALLIADYFGIDAVGIPSENAMRWSEAMWFYMLEAAKLSFYLLIHQWLLDPPTPIPGAQEKIMMALNDLPEKRPAPVLVLSID